MVMGKQAGAALGGAFGAQATAGIGGLSIGGFNIGSMINAAMRSDPDISYNYALEIDGIRSVHFKEVTGLKVTTEVQSVREGGNNIYEHKFIKGMKFEPLKIKRGFYGKHNDFYAWLRSTHDVANTSSTDPRASTVGSGRVTFALAVLRDDWTEICRFNFHGGFVMSYAGPSFDAQASGTVAFEEIEIGYDYFDFEPMSLMGSMGQAAVAGGLSMIAGAV
jgi:phage tail-like protein